MKSYPTYKKSNIDWLEKIPEGWEEAKLKYVSSCNDDVLSEKTNKNEKIKYVEIGDVDSVSGIKKVTEYAFGEAPSRARRITQKGDVIISTVRTYLKAIAKIDTDGLIVSTGFAVIRPKTIDSEFLSYVVLSSGFIDTVIAKSTGVSYPAINASELVKIKIPFPPASEQKQIASFLDYKIGQVDKAIADRESSIKDLQAYRTSVISEAVTKGLDPHAKMKDSGIEWIGEIPERWNIIKLGWIFNIKAGGDAKPELYSEVKDAEHPYPVYTNARDENQIYAYTSKPVFHKGSITVTGRGDIGHAILRNNDDFDAIIRLVVLQPKSQEVDCRYYTYFIDNVNHFDTDSSAVGQLSAQQLSPSISLQPSITEQHKIADYLDNKTSKIDKAISEIKKQIEEMKAFKQSLITEAVTGRIDVRDWKQPETNKGE